MSMQYCESCSSLVDTDFDAEHFEVNEETGETLCEEESNSNPVWLLDK